MFTLHKSRNKGPELTEEQLATLKQAREQRGWDAYDLGRQMGVTDHCVRRLESGKGGMRYETLEIWAKALGLAVSVELVDREF